MFALLSALNPLAILVSTLLAFVLAFVWYLPPTFGLRWATLTKKYTGLTDSQLGGEMPKKAALWALGFLVNAVVLGLLIQVTGTTDVISGIGIGLIVWVAGVVLSSWPVIHAGQPSGIWLMNAGLFGLQQVAMSALITTWR